MAVTPVDVAGAYGKGLQVNMMRQQMEAQKQETEQKNAMRQYLQQNLAGGIPSTPEARQQFVGGLAPIAPERALEWGGFFNNMDANRLKQYESEAPFFVAALHSVRDEPSYQQAKTTLAGRGIDTSDLPPQYNPEAVNMALQGYRYIGGITEPKGPEPTELARLYAEMNALPPNDPRRQAYENKINMLTTRAPKDTPSQGEGGPFGGTGMDAQVMNILLDQNVDPSSPIYLAAYNHYAQPKQTYNPATGQYVMITPDMSAFRQPAGRGGAATQPAEGGPAPQQQPGAPGVSVQQVGAPKLDAGETKAAGFASRMEAANRVIDELEGVGASMFGGVYNYLPNMLKPEERQRFEQAQRDFVNAVLRQQSGAVIAETEFESAAQQYFPQPGDDPKTIEQKRAARAREVENMRLSAGRAPVSEAPAPPQQTQAPGTIPPPPPGFQLVK